MTLAESERAQVIETASGALREHTTARGRGGLPGLLRALDGIAPRGHTDLSTSIDNLVRRRSVRPGMLVVLSDFFDPGPVLSALTRAVSRGHDVFLVQVIAPEEEDPDFDGDWTFEDAETGELLDLTLDAAAIEAYLARFAGLCQQLRGWSRKHGATYVRVRTDEGLEAPVRRLVGRQVD